MIVFDLSMLALLGIAFVGAVVYIHACVKLTRPAGNGTQGHR